jgi:hypothetical protein
MARSASCRSARHLVRGPVRLLGHPHRRASEAALTVLGRQIDTGFRNAPGAHRHLKFVDS